MPADTTRYSFPYQTDTDAPDGPALGEDLAVAVETALGAVDDRVGAIEDRYDALAVPVEASSPDNASGLTPTTGLQNGSTVCGASFVAPPSGRVRVHFTCTFSTNVGSGGSAWQIYMGPAVRQGGVVGSGTLVYDPSGDPGCKVGDNVSSTKSGGCSAMVSGLTPGSTYNAAATFFGVSGTATGQLISYFSRQVGVDPLP